MKLEARARLDAVHGRLVNNASTTLLVRLSDVVHYLERWPSAKVEVNMFADALTNRLEDVAAIHRHEIRVCLRFRSETRFRFSDHLDGEGTILPVNSSGALSILDFDKFIDAGTVYLNRVIRVKETSR